MRTMLSDYIQNWIDNNMGIRNFDILEFCIINGYYSWDDTIDDNGYIMDSYKIISRWDLQEACDSLGIPIDCINF